MNTVDEAHTFIVVVTLNLKQNQHAIVYMPRSFERDKVAMIEYLDQLFPHGWEGWGVATEDEIKQGKALTPDFPSQLK